ncbi:MAG: hypothetical protein HGA23_01565 [Bacteroidales bacterium]|nr:hypothetical protein [Bacteroidales bacterium]
MRKNAFLLIVLINSIALIGIIITQFLWIQESYELSEEQFSSSVRIALKGVVNQMLEYETEYPEKKETNTPDSLTIYRPEINDLNMSLLEFKINEEFKCMQLGKDYAFAIVDRNEMTIIY